MRLIPFLMGKLYFRYGAMNSGKSTSLLQVAYNYNERGQHVCVIKPSVDTKDLKVSSRINMSGEVSWHTNDDTNIIELYINAQKKIDCILVDEAQFLTPKQVEELFYIAVDLGTPVICYGLRSDFQTHGFPGSTRLLELAHSIEELKTICRCGSKAVFNGRKVNHRWVSDGEQIEIDSGGVVEYESLCGKCYIRNVGWGLSSNVSSNNS